MKKLLKVLTLIFSVFMLISCAGCDLSFLSTNTGESTGTSESGSTDSGTPPPEPEKVDPMDTWEKMPRIDIDTPDDDDNTWATAYNRTSKLNNEIDYVKATVSVSECPEDYILTDVEAEVKVRGNYTLNYAKKPIRIKYKKKQEQTMLGLHEGEKFRNWVLLADWKDKSMMNNNVSFYLGQRILGEDGYHSSDFQPVEVYLNNNYWGVYLLCEQQEVKEGDEQSRMSVPEVPGDYTGYDVGYCFEYDGYYTDERNMPDGAGDPTFTINSVSGFSMGNPGYTVKSDIYYDDGSEWEGDYTKTSTQLSFAQSYLNNVYQIATSAVRGTYKEFTSDFKSIQNSTKYTTVQETVGAVIDLRSLVDTYIYHEIVCDMDIAWSSFYMTVDMSANGRKKLIFEAPWDKDSAFGICSRAGVLRDPTQGLWAINQGNPWFSFLKNQEWFTTLVKERWQELIADNLKTDTIAHINRQLDLYGDYYIKNYAERWTTRITSTEGEVIAEIESFKDENTAQKLAAEYLRDNWIAKRFDSLSSIWLNSYAPETPEPETPDSQIPQGAQAYRYEAENASWTGNGAVRDTPDKAYHASGEAYLGGLQYGNEITFTVNASNATTAYLFARISKREIAADFTHWFTVKVNGVSLKIPSRYIEFCTEGEDAWHHFVDVKLELINLKAGANTIVFFTNTANNFDAIDVYSTVTLS